MKIYEKEQMLINEGIERGWQEAQLQFDEERQQSEQERHKLLEQQSQAEEEIRQLRKALAELTATKEDSPSH